MIVFGLNTECIILYVWIILNVLFMVCGAMAGGGGGGEGLEERNLVLPKFWSSRWPPSGNGETLMTPSPPKLKPHDFCQPPQTIDNEESLITFANNNSNRQWTNETPSWPVSNCKAREKACKQGTVALIVKRATKPRELGFPTIIVVSRTEQTRRDIGKEIKDNSPISNSSRPLNRSNEDSFIQG